MKIDFLNLRKEFKFFEKELRVSFNKLFLKQQWILSEEVAQFEKQAAAYLKIKHALGVSSGTDALVLALRGIAIARLEKEFFSPADEILVPSFTFVASGESIVRAGGTPVFLDVDYEDFNISPEAIERSITSRTRGIVVVHLFGLSARTDRIKKIADAHNLFIIEDCAQSFGARFGIEYTGSLGDCGCFSFFPTKNLGGFGDGGLISTNDNRLYKILIALRNHGGEDKYNIEHIGYNARLDTIQAEILRIKLKFLDRFLAQRRKIGEFYTGRLYPLRKHLLVPPDRLGQTFNQYTIKVLDNKRDALAGYLKERGVPTQIYYPVPLHTMKAFRQYARSCRLPVSDRLSRECLSLPVHPLLKKKEQEYVVEQIQEFFAK